VQPGQAARPAGSLDEPGGGALRDWTRHGTAAPAGPKAASHDVGRWTAAANRFRVTWCPPAALWGSRTLQHDRTRPDTETPHVLVNQVALVPVVHGLHVVAVEVAQEHAVVARVVFGPLTWGVQNLRDLRARRHSGVVGRVDGVAVGSAEGQVQFPGLGAGGWTEPEVGNAIEAGQANDEGALSTWAAMVGGGAC
jgi:hypothetical protein